MNKAKHNSTEYKLGHAKTSWTYTMEHEGFENFIWLEAKPEGVRVTVDNDFEGRKTVKNFTWDDVIGLSMQDSDLDTWSEEYRILTKQIAGTEAIDERLDLDDVITTEL